MLRSATKYLLIFGTVGVVGYDIVVYILGGGQATISDVVQTWSGGQSWLIYGMGLLMGHLFWPKPLEKKPRSRVAQHTAAGGIGVGLLTTDLALGGLGIPPPILFVLSFFVGHHLWPQYRDTTKERNKDERKEGETDGV